MSITIQRTQHLLLCKRSNECLRNRLPFQLPSHSCCFITKVILDWIYTYEERCNIDSAPTTNQRQTSHFSKSRKMWSYKSCRNCLSGCHVCHSLRFDKSRLNSPRISCSNHSLTSEEWHIYAGFQGRYNWSNRYPYTVEAGKKGWRIPLWVCHDT